MSRVASLSGRSVADRHPPSVRDHDGGPCFSPEPPTHLPADFIYRRQTKSEHLSTLDPESELLEAFASFDETGKGVIKPHELRQCLKTEGDVMSDAEVRFGAGAKPTQRSVHGEEHAVTAE